MVQQLAGELNIHCEDWLVDVPYSWLQKAREEAMHYRRAHGDLKANAADRGFEPDRDREGARASTGKGERNRKLLEPGVIVAAREKKLKAELLEIEAPVLASLEGAWIRPGLPCC